MVLIVRILPNLYLVGSGAVGLSNAGDCHVYLVDAGDSLIMFDAGGGAETERILHNVKAEGLQPENISHILLTHAHRDHANGSNALTALLPDQSLTFATSEREAYFLAHGTPEELGLDKLGMGHLPRTVSYPPFEVNTMLADGEIITIGNCQIKAIYAPGHSPGCICYLVELNGCRILFCGDVIYHGGMISLGTWLGSDLQQYQQSIRKLGQLEIDALMPGHFLWSIAGGQEHINKAIRSFDGLWPPPSINLIP